MRLLALLHSLLQPNELILRVGSNRTDKGGDYYIAVRNAMKHPLYKNFNYDYFDYDFVLLELEFPLDFSDSVKAITLPNADFQIADGAVCEVSGWGKYHCDSIISLSPLQLHFQLIVCMKMHENRSHTKSKGIHRCTPSGQRSNC